MIPPSHTHRNVTKGSRTLEWSRVGGGVGKVWVGECIMCGGEQGRLHLKRAGGGGKLSRKGTLPSDYTQRQGRGNERRSVENYRFLGKNANV